MKLSTILDQIDSQDMALPEFQRGYVWNRQQVRSLFTSLYKGYPIGGFMTWNTAVATARTRGSEIDRDGSVKLLLDGQQRATTLYGVMRGVPPRFFEGNALAFTDLYFNVYDEVFEFYAPVKMKDNPVWVNVSELMVKNVENYWASHPDISELGPAEMLKIMARITKLADVQHRDVHIEEVSGSDKTIDVVVDIFNRVNSGGTKLSKGDLALAKICASWPEARSEMNGHRLKWENAGYRFTLEWLLRNVNAVVTGEALFTALAPVAEDDIRKGLKETAGLVSVVLDVIAARLGLDFDRVFPARFAVPIIARYLHNNNGRFPNAVERDRILTWYIHAAMWGRFAGSTESYLNIDLKAVDENGIEGLMAQMLRSRGDLAVREADFGGNTIGARFYPMLYMLTRTQGAKDFTTGIALSAHMLGRNSSLQVHHIFPKAQSGTVEETGLVIHRSEESQVFWTWAGLKANLTLLAALGIDDARSDNAMIRLPTSVTIADIREAASRVAVALPFVPPQMIQGLKFSAALPIELAVGTLADRVRDPRAAAASSSSSISVVEISKQEGLVND